MLQRVQERICSVPLPASDACRHALACGHITLTIKPSISKCLFVSSSHRLLLFSAFDTRRCQTFLYLPLIRTVIAFTAHPDNPEESPHCNVLNIILSVKLLFCRVHSQVLGIRPYFSQPYLRWLWGKQKRSKDPFPTQVMAGQGERKEEKLGSKRVLTGESEARP